MKDSGSQHKAAMLIIILISLSAISIAQKKQYIESKEGIRIFAGASANSYKVRANDKNVPPGNTTFESTISPVFGIGYYSHMGFEFAKYFIYPHLRVYNFKTSGTQDVFFSNGTTYQNVTTTEKSLVISINLPFGYNIVESKSMILEMHAGPALNILAGNKQVFEKRTVSTGIVTTTEEEGEGLSYNLNIGLSAVIKNKFIIWVTTGTSTGTVRKASNAGKVSSIQGGIGYMF